MAKKERKWSGGNSLTDSIKGKSALFKRLGAPTNNIDRLIADVDVDATVESSRPKWLAGSTWNKPNFAVGCSYRNPYASPLSSHATGAAVDIVVLGDTVEHVVLQFSNHTNYPAAVADYIDKQYKAYAEAQEAVYQKYQYRTDADGVTMFYGWTEVGEVPPLPQKEEAIFVGI